jgi:hypothetical protein
LFGWGRLGVSGVGYPEVLQEINVAAISNEECKTKLGTNRIQDDIVCNVVEDGGPGCCTGDSGGPLV